MTTIKTNGDVPMENMPQKVIAARR